MPVWVVPRLAGSDLLGGQAEEEDVVLADLLADLDRGAVAGADREPPFIINFMLLVPLAS